VTRERMQPGRVPLEADDDDREKRAEPDRPRQAAAARVPFRGDRRSAVRTSYFPSRRAGSLREARVRGRPKCAASACCG
jgi:hypothetical protein